MEFRIIQKLTVNQIEKPSKKVELVVRFLTEEFNTIGLNMTYNKVVAKFASWDEDKKTVVASSMDLHKILFNACFILASRIVKDAERNSYNMDKLAIPYFFSNREDVAMLQTRKASEFDNLYYETLDAYKESKEKASATTEEETTESETTEEETTDTATAEGATASIIAMIEKYGAELDLSAIQSAIDTITKTAKKSAKKSA